MRPWVGRNLPDRGIELQLFIRLLNDFPLYSTVRTTWCNHRERLYDILRPVSNLTFLWRICVTAIVSSSCSPHGKSTGPVILRTSIVQNNKQKSATETPDRL